LARIQEAINDKYIIKTSQTSSTNDFILEAVSFLNCFFLFARSSSANSHYIIYKLFIKINLKNEKKKKKQEEEEKKE
jgi:predicted membrane protein